MFLGLFLAIFATLNMEKYAEGKYKTMPPSRLVVSFAGDIDKAKSYATAVLQDHSNSLSTINLPRVGYGDFDITQAFDSIADNGAKGILIYNTHKPTGQSYRTFVVGQLLALEGNLAHILKEFHENYQYQEKNREKEQVLRAMRKEVDTFDDKKTNLLAECEKKLQPLVAVHPSFFGVRFWSLDLEEIGRITGLVDRELKMGIRGVPFKALQDLKQILNNFYQKLSALNVECWEKMRPLLDQYYLLDNLLFGFILLNRYQDERGVSHEEIQLSEIIRIRRLISVGLRKLQPSFEEL